MLQSIFYSYRFKCLLLVFATAFILQTGKAQDSTGVQGTEIIYGHKDGLALSLVVQSPKTASNHRGIINVVLGNYISKYDWLPFYQEMSQVYLDKGYTVIYVLLGSQPRYTVPDQVKDLQRAIRFVRYHAKDYGISPDHIGITGSSAGGNLSLLAGTLDDSADPKAKDPIDRMSSRVQAVGCFYPPTDFMNFGQSGVNHPPDPTLLRFARVAAAFDFKTWDETQQRYVPVTDTAARYAIVRQISPVYAVSADDAPTMIIHGDADIVVPLQQSQEMIAVLEKAGVPCKLIVKSKGGHGWRNQSQDSKQLVDWFDKYLKDGQISLK